MTYTRRLFLEPQLFAVTHTCGHIVRYRRAHPTDPTHSLAANPPGECSYCGGWNPDAYGAAILDILIPELMPDADLDPPPQEKNYIDVLMPDKTVPPKKSWVAEKWEKLHIWRDADGTQSK